MFLVTVAGVLIALTGIFGVLIGKNISIRTPRYAVICVIVGFFAIIISIQPTLGY